MQRSITLAVHVTCMMAVRWLPDTLLMPCSVVLGLELIADETALIHTCHKQLQHEGHAQAGPLELAQLLASTLAERSLHADELFWKAAVLVQPQSVIANHMRCMLLPPRCAHAVGHACCADSACGVAFATYLTSSSCPP